MLQPFQIVNLMSPYPYPSHWKHFYAFSLQWSNLQRGVQHPTCPVSASSLTLWLPLLCCSRLMTALEFPPGSHGPYSLLFRHEQPPTHSSNWPVRPQFGHQLLKAMTIIVSFLAFKICNGYLVYSHLPSSLFCNIDEGGRPCVFCPHQIPTAWNSAWHTVYTQWILIEWTY